MGTRVYLGKLPYDARERDVEKFFKGYGRLREILMKDGFAFIEFDDHRDADDAVHELNGKDLLGERVYVEFAREQRGGRGRDRDRSYNSGGGGGGGYRSSRYEGRRYGPPRNTEYRVRVENLSSRVSWQDLKDFCRSAGEVTYADAHKRERNVGIVDFATYSDMKNAIDKLDSTELHGRRIRLSEDKSRRSKRSRSRSPRGRRSRSSSRSKSRSRSRSRSHSKSVSNGKARSKSRSQSPMDLKERSRSRSVSKGREDSRSRSPSPKRGRSASRSRSPSASRDSPRKSDRRSPESRSRSRSASQDSPRKSDRRSASHSRSRSRSMSPKDEDQNGMDD